MFDKLVESTKSRQGGRARRFFFLTTLIYGVLLIAVAVGTILNFNPALAESFDFTAFLTPPPPPTGPPPPPVQLRPSRTVVVQSAFVPPTRPTPLDEMPPDIERYRPTVRIPGVIGAPPGAGFPGLVIPGGSRVDAEVTPPPRPQPTPEPRPTPEQRPDKPVRLTSTVLQGAALRKVQPPYPAIAKQVRAQGAVPVQISISEEGVVMGAAVLDGHPLLREAALQAARQWVFRPTILNGAPVKVVGVITFNFTLN